MIVSTRQEGLILKGKLIVFEGLDGSGKNTQSEKFYEYMKNRGIRVKKKSFPDYKSQSAALINMYLSGQFGDSADSVNPYAASSFYAVDRYASYKTDWEEFYNSGGVVIADRYTTSNAIHQCSKLPESEWKAFLNWLFEYEYKYMGIPAPDKVFYLRVDPDVSQALMSVRYHNDEAKKDIHERDTDYLRRSRLSADYCARELGWDTIECTSEHKMRSIDDIFAEILGKIDNCDFN